MKKLLAWMLACILVLTVVPAVWAENAAEENPGETETTALEEAAAEEPLQITYDYGELVVAVTTPLTGNFFTTLWGNATSDIDVRSLIHGYNLVEWDTENGMFIPDSSVVSGITVQQEANGDMTFIIALYNDLLYSDGTPVTAWDYAFSFLLTMAPEMKAIGAAVLTPDYIAGYEDYISGRTKELSGVKVVADNLLHVTISSNYLPFFYELGLLDCVPYPISVIAPGVKVVDDGNGVYLANEDATVEEPVFTAELLEKTILDDETGYRTHPSVGSGAYNLVSFRNGVAQFEINLQYKGNSKRQKPMIPKITMLSMAANEMTDAYKEGKVTLLNKVSDAQTITDCLQLAAEQELMTSANYARSGLSFINFNTERAPLDDINVRQAIAYLADRDGMVKETLGAYGMKGLGYFGMGQWMYLLLNGTVLYPVEEPAENASAKEKKEYEEKLAAWEALTLDEIEKYDMDAEKGADLLDKAGWNLNENGEAFNAEQDKLRYKKTEDGLVPLQLTLAYGQGSAAGTALEGVLVQSLADAGIALKVEAIPGEDLLDQYYRMSESQYDMLFLATNFDVLYDPSLSFVDTEDGHHVWKSSGLVDDELYEMAVDMRKTEPGDLLGYCTKWLKFQKRFAEQMPVLPVYSNVYFDFYPLVLHEYHIADSISWPQTIVGAYLSDYIPEEEAETEEEPEL